jgi:exodeoxyribonuclease VII large subunit
MELKILTVSELTQYVKNTLESMVGRVRVTGEISGYKQAASGHAYFTLKDEGAALNCVMFRSSLFKVSFIPRDGVQVEVTGRITIYPARGQYQMIVEKMMEAGIGDLFRKFEAMKKRLAEEGLFDKKFKKPLPFLPRRIGVITSPTGAAVRDIINVLTRRFPHLHIFIYPALVQGTSAAGQIAKAIRRMNEMGKVDVLIIGRGGGSIEDLWAFNEEIVARAIFESKIPVVSAVGHETDFSIADFTADLRAPTPSAAAEIVTLNHIGLLENLEYLNSRLNRTMLKWIELKKMRVQQLSSSHILHSPVERLRQFQQRLDDVAERLDSGCRNILDNAGQKLKLLETKLFTLNPEAVLGRGYSIISLRKDGNIVMNSKDINKEDILDVRLYKGKLEVKVNEAIPPEIE